MDIPERAADAVPSGNTAPPTGGDTARSGDSTRPTGPDTTPPVGGDTSLGGDSSLGRDSSLGGDAAPSGGHTAAGTARPSPTDIRAWARHLHDTAEGAELVADPGAVDRLLDRLASGDLPTAFAATAARAPDEPALAVAGPWLSHGELQRRAAGVQRLVVELGVQPGDRVVLCGSTSSALVIGYLGLLRAGAVVVLANPAYTRAELAHLVADSGAGHALADPEPAGLLDDLVGHVVRLDDAASAAHGPTPEPVTPGSDAVALLAYTSGTTGAPKGVPLTHANLLSSIRGAMLAWRWSAADVLVHALPLSHQHGLGGVHATLLAGSRAVVLSRFSPDALAEAAERHRATVLFAVPAMYERLTADQVACQRVRRTLRLAVCGSAPLTPALAGRVTEALGRAPLERYGSTEAGLDVSLPLAGPGGPGTVGLPLPGVRLRLVPVAEGSDDAPNGAPGDGAERAADDGSHSAERAADDGSHGEVVVRGPQVFAGYWHNPEATAEAFRDGWFRTGDLGRLEPDTGYLRLTGRLKELIISGGMNVSPREVELALDDHPEVAEVAVAGVPSRRWGEEVTAWVVPAAGAHPDERELLEHAAGRLAPYKRPKRVYLVDELPRNTMGKVQRARLRPPDQQE